MLRDKTARCEYFDLERNKRQRGDLYVTQIMDEEMKSDDLQYEQRQKNINKTQAEYLVMLAKVLCCTVDDLIEKTE